MYDFVKKIAEYRQNDNCPESYCGNDCSKCPAYIATINNNHELRKKTANLWNERDRGKKIFWQPFDIVCFGCGSKRRVLCKSTKLCTVRKCCIKKGGIKCSDCQIFSTCNKIKKLTLEARKNIL